MGCDGRQGACFAACTGTVRGAYMHVHLHVVVANTADRTQTRQTGTGRSSAQHQRTPSVCATGCSVICMHRRIANLFYMPGLLRNMSNVVMGMDMKRFAETRVDKIRPTDL